MSYFGDEKEELFQGYREHENKRNIEEMERLYKDTHLMDVTLSLKLVSMQCLQQAQITINSFITHKVSF